ncbi:hypothetical protein [Kitasatospora viridis]|uniref:Uncharacterized protein n=1 Tax=Kitasatospora viridis TaxID=281105 RepID=A0A561SEU3_9ACTN|nr:hypothetical protein [Kitasatospora viridis]TWF73384.1 hypothetical protein FHX73_16535 [Kitasatospora viridis]
MVLLADGFSAWLVATMADAGRKKLSQFFSGTDEQGRALRSAAAAAIQLTVYELCPGDEEAAEHLARVINELFEAPTRGGARDADVTASQALEAAIGAQLAVLDDASMTGVDQSAADSLGVSAGELTARLYERLCQQIVLLGSRGGPLEPLANELNHESTHRGLAQATEVIRQVGAAVEAGFAQQAAARTTHGPSAPTMANMALHVEQLLAGLNLGEHEEAERRMNQLFLPLSHNDQRVVVEALTHEATTTADHETQLLACSLLEAADRLDTMLIALEEVEALTASANFSLRSCAAVLMWQWAQSLPGRVPVSLLARLTLPSKEDWYVHAAARAGAKTLLLRRSAARAIFDRMAASRDREDRDYAAVDLLQVAEVEPRAVPADLARKLAADRDEGVAARGAEIVRAIGGLGEREGLDYYMQFGM